MKKRYLAILMIMMISLFSITGCGSEESSDSEDKEKPVATEEANTQTAQPEETKEPSDSEPQNPVETQEPTDTENKEPEQTQEPTDTENKEPEQTQAPTDTETQAPEQTQAPTDTESKAPEQTQAPTDTEPQEPTVTQEPVTNQTGKLEKAGVYTLYNEATNSYLSFEDRTLVLSKDPVNWTFNVEHDDVFRIFAEDSDLMLDIDNAVVKEGTTIKIWTRTEYDVQLWNAIKNENGTYSIVYSTDNTFCLGFNNGKAELQRRNKTNTMQEWKLVEINTEIETNKEVEAKTGIYTLYNENTGKYLSFNDKTLVLSENPSNWTLNEVYKDKFHIFAEDTDTLLDIDNARVKEGNTVKLWTLTGYDVQLWSINKNNNGTFTFAYSGDNKYCLGFRDGNAQLQVRDEKNPAQEWKLVDVSASAKNKYRTYISENGIIELQLPVDIIDVISETRLQKWANDLETAYYTFKELTNYTPYEHIIVQAYKEKKHIGYVTNNSNIIHIDKDFIREDLAKMAVRESDWNFCALHEMGHMFDMGQAWNFEAEVLTDIKVAYVLEKNGVAAAPSEFDASEYFYGADIIKAYERLGKDFSTSYNIYGIAKRFLEIKEDIGWEAFEKTFHDLRTKEGSYVNCSNEEKLEAFVDRLAFYGSKDVKSCFSKDEWNVIINEINS